MTDAPVTVVVADDHPAFRAGIRDALEKGGQVEVVGEADDGEDALLRMVAPMLGLTDQESAMARQRVEEKRFRT